MSVPSDKYGDVLDPPPPPGDDDDDRALATGHQISESIRAATDYLSRHLSPSGRFNYVYDPRRNQPSSKYNLLRHAGTTMVLYRIVGSRFDGGSLDQVASRAWLYLRSFITTARDSSSSCLVDKAVAKLGGTALTLLALAARMGRSALQEESEVRLLAQLARYLASQQREDGSFISKRDFTTGKEIPFDSLYYPGEAVLALCAAFRLTGDVRFRDNAIRGAQYLTEGPSIYRANDSITDHWLMMSLAALHVLAPDPKWSHQLRRLAAWLTDRPSFWLSTGATTEVATRLEALVAALDVEVRLGDGARARLLSRTLRRGLAYCYERQVGAHHFLRRDILARGGLTQSPWTSSIRIDYVQHTLAASFGAINLLNIMGPLS